MQSKKLKLIGITDGTPKRPRILNILHVPKTGGSSVWHTIADFSRVRNPPATYDFFHEAVRARLPFDPIAGAIHFLCVTGLLTDYHREIYDWHAASHFRFAKALRSTVTPSVLLHTHFPGHFCKLPEESVTISTTRESWSRFLSHAAHLLRELRRYQDAVTKEECASEPLLSEFSEFPRDKPVLDFCRELAALRPTIATHQLRYLLANLCSGDAKESFEIMAKWSNREVIKEFKRSFEFIQAKTTTIRLEEDGQITISADAQETLCNFGFGDFEVNRSVLETVTTPRELKGKAADVFEMFSADRAFHKSLFAENELLSELHGVPSLRTRVRYFFCGSGWHASKCA